MIAITISPQQTITKDLADLVEYISGIKPVNVSYGPDFGADWNILIPLFDTDTRMIAFVQGLLKQKYGGRITYVSPTIPFELAKENAVDYVATINGIRMKYFFT